MSEAAVVICTVLAGAIAVPLVNWLKSTVKIKGQPLNTYLVLLLSFLVSAVLGLFAAWLVGDIAGVPLTEEGVRAALTTAFTFATLIYKLTKKEVEPVEERLPPG